MARNALTGDTRLNVVLTDIPDALEYIVALKPHDFQRLRNPFARKYMAGRITLGRVAAMAGIPLAQFLHDITSLDPRDVGEPPAESTADESQTLPQSSATPPQWFQAYDPAAVHWVDVLAIDDVLGDPLMPIVVALKQLAPDGVIGIRHRWEPQPLYDVWQKMRLEWFAEKAGEDEWHIFVHKPRTFLPPTIPSSIAVEVRHLPESEIVPRVVAVFAQLQPGQRLDVHGITHERATVLQQVYAQTYPGQYTWQTDNEGEGKTTIRITLTKMSDITYNDVYRSPL